VLQHVTASHKPRATLNCKEALAQQVELPKFYNPVQTLLAARRDVITPADTQSGEGAENREGDRPGRLVEPLDRPQEAEEGMQEITGGTSTGTCTCLPHQQLATGSCPRPGAQEAEDRGVQRKQAVAGDEEKIFPLMIDADSTRPPASPPGILPVRLIPPPRVCVRSSRREGPYEALLDRESLVKRRPTRMKIQYNA
jgi:hypothetical protein